MKSFELSWWCTVLYTEYRGKFYTEESYNTGAPKLPFRVTAVKTLLPLQNMLELLP
jgi:hypothetical protein